MARLVWTQSALADLEDIAEYIALDNPSAAKKMVRNVFSKLERLSRHPLSGRRPPELRSSNYREVIVTPCRIFYRVEKERVYILHMMRGEKLLRKYLLDERDSKNDDD